MICGHTHLRDHRLRLRERRTAQRLRHGRCELVGAVRLGLEARLHARHLRLGADARPRRLPQTCRHLPSRGKERGVRGGSTGGLQGVLRGSTGGPQGVYRGSTG
eukprot:7569230-Pyramimonas_sp.AAC.2